MKPVFILFSIVCYAAYVLSLERLCYRALGYARGNRIIFVAALLGGSIGLQAVCGIWEIPYIVIALCRHVLFVGLVCMLFRREREKKWMAAAAIIACKELVGNFSGSLLSCAALVLHYAVSRDEMAVLDGWQAELVLCLSFIPVIGVINWLAGQRGARIFTGRGKSWYVMVAILRFKGIFLVDLSNWGASQGILFRGGDNWSLYYNQLFSYGAMGVLTVLLLCISFGFVYGMNRIYMEQAQKEQYRGQVAFYRALEEHYRQVERVRHDLKNHIICLRELLEKQELDKMERYLGQMQKKGNVLKDGDITGNRVVDALLYEKRNLAGRAGIVWECDASVPGCLAMDEYDLCVLLGNILDNAIEECGRIDRDQPLIRIKAGMVKGCLLLEVSNSSDIKSDRELFVSKKEDPGEHGIGWMNITETVQKYNGVIHTELAEGTVTISVLLPLGQAVHDSE